MHLKLCNANDAITIFKIQFNSKNLFKPFAMIAKRKYANKPFRLKPQHKHSTPSVIIGY